MLGGVRSKNMSDDEELTVQEAVDTAGHLRREAYAAHKIIF